MVTGDAPATAATVARAVGIEGALCPPGPLPEGARPETFAVFAGVLPEDKYRLVQAFQRAGHTVGMCGDGANDAPALRQAQMGIAVSTATDVAKSAAGIVLTKPGLEGVVAAVREGRVTFQRILTYTLSSVTKKVVQVLFLAAGLLITGHAILTPLLMVLMMLTGDFLGMSLTTDHVRPSETPSVWRVGSLTLAGVFMGLAELGLCLTVLLIGKLELGLGLDALRTLAFVAIVFGNQATTYANRSRQRLWSTRPSAWVSGLVGRRCGDRVNHGEPRVRHGALAMVRARRHARPGSGLRLPRGPAQGPRLSPPSDCLGRGLSGRSLPLKDPRPPGQRFWRAAEGPRGSRDRRWSRSG